jgi:Na+-driven multidrug efflux pump
VGALSGLGKTRLCSVISIVATGMRIPLAMILSGTALGLDGVWWALSVTSITKGILFYIAFERQAAKLHRETSSEDRHV